MSRLLTCIIAIAMLVPLSAHSAAVVVRDIAGRALTLLAPAPGRWDLLFFINRECPISNRYAPEITRICTDYQSQGIRCVLVYPDATVTPAEISQHRREFGYGATTAAVIDRDFALTKAVDATVTPEAFIYSSAGKMYHGRIDDLYVDVGKARRAATTHDLRSALDAVIGGRPVRVQATEPVGCSIERR